MRDQPSRCASSKREPLLVLFKQPKPNIPTMNTTIRTAIACLVVASAAVAAPPNTRPLLTPKRLAELTAPTDAPKPKSYKIEISELGSASLPEAKPEGEIEAVREFRFPVEFALAKATAVDGSPSVTPTTPTAFAQANTGWTVQLSATPHGKLVIVFVHAHYVEAELVTGAYGEIAGPVYTERGEVITPNKLDQPKIQTTATRLYLCAIPGQSYEVTLYRGAKAEKHTITVKAE
jgi:hypothetical protein